MKLKDILKDSGIELGKVFTDKDMPPFQVKEYGYKTSELVGTQKKPFGSIYNMKEEMKEGKFDPKNPTITVHGLGVYDLKTLQKVIKRDLTKAAGDVGHEQGVKNLMYHLYGRLTPLSSKIKGLQEVYEQMNTPQYKRAVTMYKRKR